MLVTNRPLPGGRLSSFLVGFCSTRRKAPALVIALAAFLAVSAVPASADSVASKQAQAQSVLGQIQQLDSSLERAIEAYNLANSRLAGIRHDLSMNTHNLVSAKRSLKHAQRQLSSRLIDLYTSEGQDSTLAVLLGSSSLDDMLSNMDAVDRLSQQDAVVLKQVVTLRREIQQRQRRLKHAHAVQSEVVAQRAVGEGVGGEPAQPAPLAFGLDPRRDRAPAGAGTAAAGRAAGPGEQQLARRRSFTSSGQALAQTVGDRSRASAPRRSRFGGVVGIAMRYLGTPYVWGGASPRGFDCSGFTMYVYAQVGVSLPAQRGDAVRDGRAGLPRRPPAR